jgi:hypothetical protein
VTVYIVEFDDCPPDVPSRVGPFDSRSAADSHAVHLVARGRLPHGSWCVAPVEPPVALPCHCGGVLNPDDARAGADLCRSCMRALIDDQLGSFTRPRSSTTHEKGHDT